MNGITIPAIIENVATRKDKTIKLTMGTNEMTPSDAGWLMSLQNNLVAVYICDKEVSQIEIDKVDKLQPELNGKSQSQRIRNTLAVLFKQDSEGFKDFDSYYHNKTEKYIEKLKSLIQQ